MALSDWTVYVPLLDALLEQRDKWETAKSFTEFDEAITRSCADLRGGENSSYDEYGLDSLVEELRGDLVGDFELVYEQIRLAALATQRPDLGEQWAGRFVSKRSDGTNAWSMNRYALPSAWEKADLSVEVPEPVPVEVPAPLPEQAPALTLDPETGLLYDAVNWYLKDGKTIVTEVEGADYFVDPMTSIRYRRGEAFLWPDTEAGLLYDAVNWYLKDGKTIVTEVEGTDYFVDPMTSIRYRRGEAFLWPDTEAGLLYDAVNWYLKDGRTIVTEVEGTDEFVDPKTSIHYRKGEPIPVTPPPQPPAEPAPSELPPAAEKQLVAKLVEVRSAKAAELLDQLQEDGWSPAATPEEAAELRAQGDETAFTVEEVLKMLDTKVEQLLGT